MAVQAWISGAPTVAQVTTVTVGGTPVLTPATPVLTSTATGGTLAAGVYQAAVLYGDEGNFSTTSAIASITLTGSTSTLTVSVPSGANPPYGSYWIWELYLTEPGGSTFYYVGLANKGQSLTLTAPPSYSTPVTVPNSAEFYTTYTLAMGVNGSKSVSYQATATDTNTTVATALTNLASSCGYPEFAEVTWSNTSAGVITGTAAVAGNPFLLTTSTLGAGTLTQATVTASSDPTDVSVAANWSNNVLPQNGDSIYVGNNAGSMLHNLQALASVVLGPGGIQWDTTFTGNCGLPAVNPNGYEEYRQRYFQIQSPVDNFSSGSGGGSSLLLRDNTTYAWTVNVAATGTSQTQGIPALIVKGTNAANVLTVTRGFVGTAIDPGDASQWASVNVGYQTSPQTDAAVILGMGGTVAAIEQTAGSVSCFAAVGNWMQRGGSGYFYGSGNIAALDVEGGTFFYQSSGVCTALTVGINGKLDCRQDPRTRTFTNSTIYGTLLDPNKTITFTNPVYFPDGLPDNCQFGTNIHLQRS